MSTSAQRIAATIGSGVRWLGILVGTGVFLFGATYYATHEAPGRDAGDPGLRRLRAAAVPEGGNELATPPETRAVARGAVPGKKSSRLVLALLALQ